MEKEEKEVERNEEALFVKICGLLLAILLMLLMATVGIAAIKLILFIIQL